MSIGNGFGALLTLLITAVAMAAAGQQLAAGQEEVSRAVERAKAASTAFTQELLKTLLAELKAGGPQRAVAVCSVKAAELARAHSGEGVELRRVTLKTRNPENRPDPFEERQLQAMAAQLEKTGQSKEVTEVFEEGHRLTVRYMRPILWGKCV
ncbi:MAG: DUF3365 domain-containing protein [Thermoanaerobaculum sp.]|nr:DUF3365 domain-containing protein [Thermoanaerobaculum sp.]MDW7966545.1 DUF3365 domain-containing protein [Thermoanaerobaculum sp.]